MASKLEASVERDPNHAGTRILVTFRRVKTQPLRPAATAAAK
jgi:hypothetical protein